MNTLSFSGSASRGGARLLIASLGGIAILLLYTVFFASDFSWLLAIAYLACFLAAFIGWAKLAEPRYSLVCDAAGIHYHHRAGSWLLPWDAFSHSAVPSVAGQDLAFIGFKITNFDVILQQIPLRLAVRIMTEQRPLYFEAIKRGCNDGRCATELLNEKDRFVTANHEYNGVKAIFAQRMQKLAELCGMELLVPINSDNADTHHWCQQINKLRLAQRHLDT